MRQSTGARGLERPGFTNPDKASELDVSTEIFRRVKDFLWPRGFRRGVDDRHLSGLNAVVDRDLQTLLLRDNPWLVDDEGLGDWLRARLPATFVPRQVAASAAERWSELHRAHLVIGPRQAGKSTTIWAHLAAAGERALFIDCEQALVRDWCRSAPLFLGDLEKLAARPVTLFFEEAQHLKEAGLFFKGLVDRRYQAPILVTGSSSYHLGARTRESLAGRATRTRLLPFSLAEVCDDLGDTGELVRARLVEDRLARHLIFGGYPEIWLSERPELLLTDLVEAIILRDASDLNTIGRPEAFRRLLRLTAAQAGNLINVSEWAAILGISRDTVGSYLEILESGHVVAVVPPFAGGRRAELVKAPKIFLLDNGIRHQLAHDFRALEDRTDAGQVLENWAFTELWKALPEGATLHFWRSTSKAEVDFVVARGDRVVGVEVKAARLGRPSLARAARSFLDAYRPARFFMVNTGIAHREQIGGSTVRWLAPAGLADAVARAFA